MKSTAALAVILVSALAVPMSSTVTAASAAATPTCHGKTATIVGSPDREHLRGTNGRDVIVTNGSRYVNALKGADTICITNGGTDRFFSVAAGPGNDWVQSHTKDEVHLGSGNDTYIGSVHANRVYDDRQDSPEGRDVINTGRGGDLVFVARGIGGFQDVVSTGRRNDTVEVGPLEAGPVGNGSIEAPDSLSGVDRIIFAPIDSLRIDVPGESVWSRGTRQFTLKGFRNFVLPDAPGHLNFVGGAAGENLALGEPNAHVTTGAGNDTVSTGESVLNQIARGAGTDIDLGGGVDGLWLSTLNDHTGSFDMESGAFSVDGGSARIAGANRFDTANWADLTLHGTSGGDWINIAAACALTIDTRAGSDTIEIPSADSVCTRVVHGGAGDDVIRGSAYDEELYGDEGYDKVYGGGGHDICEAEVADCPA